MAKYLTLPDGSSFEMKEGQTPAEAMQAAIRLYPDAFGFGAEKPSKDTSGFKAAASAGFERLKGQTALTAAKLGLKDTAEAEAYQKQQEAKAAARFTPTEQGWTEAPFQKFKETLGGSVPYMVAPVAAGAAALAAPVSAPVAAGLGLLGAGAVSTGQFTGSNLARQVETGKTLEEASLGKAVGAAVPQALLDTAAMALLPGVGKLFGSVGSKLTNEQAKAIASQTLGKTVADYAAKTGTAMGREGVTEATQQLLERLQAGLQITDPEARKEYVESFIGGAVLGGAAAPVGRAFERSGAKKQAEAAQQQEQAEAAAAAEAAKNSPEALRQLDTDFRAADQQLKALNAQLNAAKPKKGATDEQKQAYEALKEQRDELLVSYKPLRQEFQKRKGAIDEMQMAEQTALETAAAQDQTAAKLPLPSDIPDAQPFQLSDTSRLMNEYDTLRSQVATVEQQLAAGPDVDTQTALTQQRGELMARMAEMGPIIEERGGVIDTEKEFAKKMVAAEKERLRLLEIGDFDAAANQAEVVRDLQARAPFLQELNDFRTKAGQNRDLFTEMPEQPEGVGVQYAAYPKGKKVDLAEKPSAPITPFPATAAEAAPLPSDKPEELATVQTAQTGVATAQQALDEAVKTKDTNKIFGAVDALNQAQNTVARAQEDVGRPLLKPTVLDIFSPANLFQTAFANNDTKLLNDLASHADTTALRTALDQNLSEREKLINVLENRAGVGGDAKAIDPRTGEPGEPLKSVKRERADLFANLYDARQQALFKNGTYPDRELQTLYDKGGPAAVEYERVMQDVEELAKKVTTKQGNAKQSLYEQLVDLASQHSALVAQMEAGIATPNMREKTAALQAKMGKGEAPAERQMDAAEKYQLQRKIDAVVNKYKLTEGQITPIRDQINKLYNSLYKTTPLEKTSKAADRKATEAEERKERAKPLKEIADQYGMKSPEYKEALAKQVAESKAAGRVPKVAVSRTAKTATRIAKGDVRKEAETSQKMRDLARDLGTEEAEYKKFEKAQTDRYTKLKEKYGKNDPAVTEFQIGMADQLNAKAMELGKQTPEYKATLKEQIEYVKGALAQSKQTVPTKRTGQVTRKQSAAPSRLVTSSPESRAQTDIEDRAVRIKRGSLKDFQEALDSEKYGTAYRLKEGESDTVVDAAEAQKVIDGLKLPDNVKFIYAPTARQVPVKLLNQMAADGIDAVDGVVRGAVFPDGTVLVVGDQHADVKDLEETIAHELVGHYGIDTLIGSERLNAFAKKTDVIALAEQLGGKPLVSEVVATVRANAALGRSEEVQKLQALREIIAHTEEARVTEAFREKAGRWLKELVGMVRAGLRDMGFKNLSELSTSDVFYMLKRSRKAFANKTIGPYPINAQQNLKNWLGDSKVVDNDGKPLVLYHGTDAENIDVFDPARIGASKQNALGRGFYAGSKYYASGYAGQDGTVLPLYTRIETPLYFDDELFAPKGLPEADAANMAAYEKVRAADPQLAANVFKLKDGRVVSINASKPNWKNFERAMDIAGVDGVIDKIAKAFGGPNKGKPDIHQVMVRSNYQLKHAEKNVGTFSRATPNIAFRLRKQSSEYGVGRPAGVMDTVVGNMLGLAGRVQFIDQYAALDAATKKGLSAGVISSLEATNANYLLRFGQQRSQFAGQFLTNGPVKAEITRKDGGTETLYRSTKGVSMVDVAKKLNEAKIGNDTEQEDMFTLYIAGERANQIGWDKLNYSDPADAKAKYTKMMARLNSSDTAKAAFKEAAKLYQQYNAGLLDFLVDTGALSVKKAAELKAISYVPFYRINGNGEVQLMVDKERPVRIANIKDQPQLKELVGGNTEIMPIFTSAAQNTFMITGMGLRNQAVKETSFMLQKLGIASRVSAGNGPTGTNVVRFFKKGEPYHAVIDTDAYGIPAELIVRGMEGIKTTLPAIVKLMGIPANILRSFVVRNPTYAVRQIIRDPLNAWLTTGTDAVPVLSSMKELAKMVAGRSDAERKLMETGAISSNVYSGDDQDMAKFLKDMSAGKSGWDKATAMLDTFALQGDAATRAVIYKDSLAKGMSEQEALLRTLESMNFSRRGVSPSMQALSTLIPFFNAQVQGLDVIYRAFKGDMPYSQQLDIRGKMVRRGALLAAGTIAYAMLMQDDEAYQRAKPEERLANWFVYVPGIAEPVRVPIPFEMGFLFKALPEAIYNMAMQDDKADAAIKGLGRLALQTVPLSLPQAVKPITEVILGKSFYSGDIESTREKDVLPTQRYRDNSTELAKMIGAVTGNIGLSPITLDYLIRGYTGGLGIALVQLANPILAPSGKPEVAEPTTKVSKTPFIGGLFQPVEGRGTLDEAYDRMTEIRQVKGTFNDLVNKGKRAEAMAFAQEYSDKLATASISGSVQKQLGELAKLERQIKAAPNMTTEQKDAQLERLDKAKTAIARQFLATTAQR